MTSNATTRIGLVKESLANYIDTLRDQNAPTTTFVLTMQAEGPSAASGRSVAHATVTFVNADLIAAGRELGQEIAQLEGELARIEAEGMLIEDLMDERFVRQLEETGAIDRTLSHYGIK